jgi:hypothetical protein
LRRRQTPAICRNHEKNEPHLRDIFDDERLDACGNQTVAHKDGIKVARRSVDRDRIAQGHE